MAQIKKAQCVFAAKVLLIVAATVYVVFVFAYVTQQHERALQKVQSQQSLTKRIERIDTQLATAKDVLKEQQQIYTVYRQRFQHKQCLNGAYTEFSKLAGTHNIHINKLEQAKQADSETVHAPSTHSVWDTRYMHSELSGSWTNYLAFRRVLVQSDCFFDIFSEHIRATAVPHQIQAQLRIGVLYLHEDSS